MLSQVELIARLDREARLLRRTIAAHAIATRPDVHNPDHLEDARKFLVQMMEKDR